jgi:hypothetical protein
VKFINILELHTVEIFQLTAEYEMEQLFGFCLILHDRPAMKSVKKAGDSG